MQVEFRRGARRTALRFFGWYLLLSLITLYLLQAAHAQESSPMSPSVVLVLKLVSKTHVKPITGIVVSDEGMVLVPSDFVTADSAPAEAEILVLDGGTDIIGHGRPAKIISHSLPGGLALLSVNGLKRPGITLAESTLGDKGELHLAAFPPAEYIAKGAQPLWVAVEVLADEMNRRVILSPATPLPYITGPIIDACGYLSGLSLASGAQSLDSGKAPLIFFADELSRILDSMEIKLPRASCRPQVQNTSASTLEINDVADNVTEPENTVQETSETKVLATETQQADIRTASSDANQVAVVDPGTLMSPIVADRPSLWRSVPWWLLPIGIIVLAVLIWKGFFFIRLINKKAKQISSPRGADHRQSASEEPDTTQLQSGADAAVGKPRSVQIEEVNIPDMDKLPAGCNGMVLIEGVVGTDIRFKRYCAVNTLQIDIVIGRGAADLCIEHPAISRAHVRLECDGNSMTLSDLGSSNGTFIKGVPCLPGEVLFVEAEDEIFLGDVRFRISVITKKVDLV